MAKQERDAESKKKRNKWVFRILFALTIIYHAWSFVMFGLEPFKLFGFNVPFQISAYLFAFLFNCLNYFTQIVLPLLFFYEGFIKK